MYHKELKKQNEDHMLCGDNKKYAFIILAHPISGCSKGLNGAQTACTVTMDLLNKKGNDFFEMHNSKIAYLITSQVFYELKEKAKKDGVPVSEYSSTLAFVLYSKKLKKHIIFNLGNNLIFLTHGDQCADFIKKGVDCREVVCTTTENVFTKVLAKKQSLDQVESACIFSDGIASAFCENKDLFDMIVKSVSMGDFTLLTDYFESTNNYNGLSFIAFCNTVDKS